MAIAGFPIMGYPIMGQHYVFDHIGVGGVVCNGAILVSHDIEVEGGIVINGTAVTQLIVAVTGGVVCNGTAQSGFVYSFSSVIGVIVSGRVRAGFRGDGFPDVYENIPDTWFKYDFPLTGEHGPSGANYNNVNPLIEYFASLLGVERTEIKFRFENGSPSNPDDDIIVEHPDDADYLPAFLAAHSERSPEILHYELHAKNSHRLRLFLQNSPAQIEYFQDL